MIPSTLKTGDVVRLAKLDTARDRHRRRANRNLAIVTKVGDNECTVRTHIKRSDGTTYYKNIVIFKFDMSEPEIIIKCETKEAMLYKLEHA